MNRTLVLGICIFLGGCNETPSDWGYTYRVEVGYYEKGEKAWFVGLDQKYADCVRDARNRFNAINAGHPNRAFSWACRQMKGESFQDRVR